MNALRFLAIGLFLTACGADKSADSAEEDLHVMRNCKAAEGRICPWAGDGVYGFNGEGVDALDAWFSFPMSVTMSPYGKPLIADWNNHKIRMLEDDGTLTTIMGTDFLGDGDPDHLDSTPAGAPGTSVALNHPTMQEYWPSGLMLSASWHTHKLRTWDPATGLVHVICGAGAGSTGNDPEPVADALLNQPKEVLITSTEDVYVLDMRNEQIRFLDMDSQTLTTVAGSGVKDYCGDGGPAVEACFNFPKNANPEPGGSIALDEAGGLLYVADTESHIIRVIDLDTGIIDLLAGTPLTAGDVDGPGAQAQFNFPTDITLDGNTLFVADANNHKVRAIDVTTGVVSTFAGTGEASCPIVGDVATPQICDEQHRGGDGGPATEATLYRPFGVDLDLDGNLLISDSYNQRIRIVYR